MVIKTKKSIDDLVEFIKKRIDPEKIYLFGSHATGSYTDESDIDFLIIQNTNLPKHKRAIPLYNAGRMQISKESVDFIIYTPNEFSLWSKYKNSIAGEVLETGKLLYEKQ